MKLRSKQLLSVWIGIILILTVVSSAAAGRFGGGHIPFDGKGAMGLKTFIELNLTETQKADALKTIEGFMVFRDSKQEAMQAARADMKAVMQAETFDEEQAREAFRQTTAIREVLFIERGKMMAELKAILTPEQRERLKQKQAQRQERFRSRILSLFQESSQ